MRRSLFTPWKQFIAVVAILTTLPSPLLFLPSFALKASPAMAGGNPTEEDRDRVRAEYEAYREKEKREGQERLETILDAHEANWRPIEKIAPYWKQGDGFTSTIVINNTRPREIKISAAVLDADGRVLRQQPFKIRPTGSLDVPLAALIGNQEGFGQIALRYEGEPLEINALLVVADSSRSLSVDHPFDLAEDYTSAELEGVFYMPASSTRSELALANTSNQALSVLVSVRPENSSGALEQHVAIMPYHTEIVNVRPLLQGSNGLVPIAARVQVKHTGNPGDLRVHGMLMDANGYSSNMRFLERSALGGNKLFSPVLPLQNAVSPLVLLTNTNSGAATVHLEAYYSLNGELEETTLRTVSVPADGAVHADLSREMQGLPVGAADIGLVIEHYKEGGLLADVLLVDGSGSGVYQVSPKGYAGHPHNDHSFPFRLDGGLNTIITIANPSEAEDILYSINLYYEGKVYGVKTAPLRPGEVRNVNIKALRDQQIKGALQERLPANVTGGQATLHFRRRRKPGGATGGETTHAGHGAEAALGIASATTFDVEGKVAFVTCYPDCDPENWTMELANQYYEGVVGDIVTYSLTVYNVNNGYFNLEASDIDWIDDGEPITDAGNNQVILLQPGYANLSASVTIIDDACDDMCTCVQIFGEVLYLQGWVVSYDYTATVTSVNLDNINGVGGGLDDEDPDEQEGYGSVTVAVDAPYWIPQAVLALNVERSGDSAVQLFSGSRPPGEYEFQFLENQQDRTPAGTYNLVTLSYGPKSAQAVQIAKVKVAYPVNFRRVDGDATSYPGELYFEYKWDSSTKTYAELGVCEIGELSTFPGGDPFLWPYPYADVFGVGVFTTPNPKPNFINGLGRNTGNGNDPVLPDTHTKITEIRPAASILPGNYTVEIKQIYAYKCPGKNNGQPVKMKSYTITRRVKMDGGVWKSNVSKDGFTSPYWVIP